MLPHELAASKYLWAKSSPHPTQFSVDAELQDSSVRASIAARCLTRAFSLLVNATRHPITAFGPVPPTLLSPRG
ncbi:hypothetical protein Plhal304r1_c009g0037091 [Plasmopara halstedii]